MTKIQRKARECVTQVLPHLGKVTNIFVYWAVVSRYAAAHEYYDRFITRPPVKAIYDDDRRKIATPWYQRLGQIDRHSPKIVSRTMQRIMSATDETGDGNLGTVRFDGVWS
jgi:hypothetical protein